LVYDAHELYPEQFQDVVRRKFWNVVESRTLEYADEIILPEKNRAAYFTKKYGRNNVHVVQNFPSCRPVTRCELLEEMAPTSKNKTKLLYVGAMFESRGIVDMVNAIALLPDDYCLFLMGQVSAGLKGTLQDLILKNGLSNRVYILQPVENRQVLSVINSADVGLLFYNDGNINDYYCASNKLYEFIVCSKHVVTNDYPGLREIVQVNGFGQCIEDVSASSIARAVSKITIDGSSFPGTERFIWGNQAEKFVAIYS